MCFIILVDYVYTQVGPEVLDKLQSLLLLLPEFDMAIRASSDQEVSPARRKATLSIS